MAYNRTTALITGIDIPIPECELILHQPTIEEISYMPREEFFTGIQTLGVEGTMISKDESVLEQVSNFQIFMTIMQEEETKDKREFTLQVLDLIFPKYKISITPRSIIFSDTNGVRMVDENNFKYLQEVINEVFCLNKKNDDDLPEYNPVGKKAKEIAEKLMKGRKKVAELKAKENGDIIVTYMSVLSVGLHIPLTEIKKYTLFMLYDQLERYSLHMSWDLDIRSRLAGGSPEGKPPDWMKNIHKQS